MRRLIRLNQFNLIDISKMLILLNKVFRKIFHENIS